MLGAVEIIALQGEAGRLRHLDAYIDSTPKVSNNRPYTEYLGLQIERNRRFGEISSYTRIAGIVRQITTHGRNRGGGAARTASMAELSAEQGRPRWKPPVPCP